MKQPKYVEINLTVPNLVRVNMIGGEFGPEDNLIFGGYQDRSFELACKRARDEAAEEKCGIVISL